ncbi:GTP 3',8-cyclase [subsurface metagenome]
MREKWKNKYSDFSDTINNVESKFEYNGKLRIKLTDKCNLRCPFCHYEGTPKVKEISTEDTNLHKWLLIFRKYFNKIHLTGGEPTLYSRLKEIVKLFKKYEYEIVITTNGTILNDDFKQLLPYFNYVNVSFHTLNSGYFEDFVYTKEKSHFYIKKIMDNVLYLKNFYGKVRLNTVVTPMSEQNLLDIINFSMQNNIPLKLVPDWRFYKEGMDFINMTLTKHNFKLASIISKIPGSNVRKIFKNNEGYNIEVKDLHPCYLPFWCQKCELKEKCLETFAFLRLEGNPLKFKICISKPSINARLFEENIWPFLKIELVKALKYKEHLYEK